MTKRNLLSSIAVEGISTFTLGLSTTSTHPTLTILPGCYLSLTEDPIINEKEQYWLFRGDINIIMMWYRVRSCLFLCLILLIDGMGG